MKNVIQEMLRESAGVKTALADSLAGEIATFARWMTETYRHGGKVILFGNGGSLCDCLHIAEELVGRYKEERKALPAIALAEPTLLTAIGNDFGFEAVFTRQIEAWVKPGDLVVGLTTSGNSPNVRAGLQLARDMGARAVALTGVAGAHMSEVADLVLCVPSTNTPRIQECHITIGHIVCEIAEKELGMVPGGSVHV
ncbi:MAG TPA: SIS domain-containing protein [Armatimonadota bacterium]|jgi:D-sedoheptulose 7-phosphate isomerase